MMVRAGLVALSFLLAGGASASECPDLDAEQMVARAAAPASLPPGFYDAAMDYYQCRAAGVPPALSACDALTPIAKRGRVSRPTLVEQCQERARETRLIAALARGTEDAMPACVDNPPWVQMFPQEKLPEVCRILVQDFRRPRRASERMSALFRQGIEDYTCNIVRAYGNDHRKALRETFKVWAGDAGACEEFGRARRKDSILELEYAACRRYVRLKKAVAAKDPEKCGDDGICRGMMGQLGRCDSLAAEMRRQFCASPAQLTAK